MSEQSTALLEKLPPVGPRSLGHVLIKPAGKRASRGHGFLYLQTARARNEPSVESVCKQGRGGNAVIITVGTNTPGKNGGMMKVPVAVIRLPRGPDGTSRGFDPNSPRFQALGPASLSPALSGDLEQEQEARVVLRERYLRSLLAMAGRPVRFTMHEKVSITALFGASDVDILNFQVSNLETPLGVQREALLRCSDIIAYSFEL